MRFIALFCMLVSPLLSHASTVNTPNYHAIVVGVSEYPNLPDGLDLSGPKYDALRVQSMLLQQGVAEANIQLLADGVPSAVLPTKANILKAFAQLESNLKPGDFAYLHFSGHGSQQPSVLTGATKNSDSVDGLDEIFLPRDTGAWSKNIGTVENSLSDNEVDILVTRLRNIGANVWIIFDSCHSGTMTRSVTGKEIRSRSIEPKVLGISSDNNTISKGSLGTPPEKGNRIAPSSLTPVALSENAGALMSFGAAQSNEEAPEMSLPSGEGEAPQGLFTFVMTSIISQNPNISYRQLAQSILASYNSLPWHRTTPLFEGGQSLDQPIFHKTEEVTTVYAVTTKKGHHFIQGGQLNGLEVGAVVDIYADISAKNRVATLEIIQADMTTSEGRLVEGDIDTRYSYAELASPAFPKPLTVKWQVLPDANWVDAAVTLIEKSELLDRTVKWVETDQPADISLYAGRDTLYFFTLENEKLPCQLQSNSGVCDVDERETYLSKPLDEGELNRYEVLNNGLSRMVRSRNLKRLSASLTGRSPIVSEVFLNEQPQSLDQVVKATDGDDLYVSFVNRGRAPIDLTVMFIDSGMGIYQVFPEPGYSGRLFAGEAAEFEGNVSKSTTGEEQFVVIAIPTNRQAPQVSLSHLQQEPMQSSKFFDSQSFSVKARGSASVEDLFAQSLGDTPQTRAFEKKGKSVGKASINVIRLRTD